MTDRIETEVLTFARTVRDTLGQHGDLFMRLTGFYRIGPDGPVEPEFGYRDMRDSPLRQGIQLEAAVAIVAIATEAQKSRDRIEQLERDLAAEKARIDPLQIATNCLARAAEIFNSDGKFVGNTRGDCLCSFITGKDVMDAKKARDAA